MGMMLARNACHNEAKQKLVLGLINDPALKSFGSSPGHPMGAGLDLPELYGEVDWFRVEQEKVLEGFLKSLDIDPQEEIAALDKEGKEKTFKTFTVAFFFLNKTHRLPYPHKTPHPTHSITLPLPA